MAETASAAGIATEDALGEEPSLGALHGMLIAVKDNVDTAGILTTYGSAFFNDHVPSEDAEVVKLLKAQGAIIIGKTNLDEFGLGGTTQNPHHGSCLNPWDLGRIPGGSSGGSAVAVATGMCTAAIGTDTGGSVRIPASANGIVGLRPTRGRVSMRGVMPVSERFDTVGLMARNVSDIDRLLTALRTPRVRRNSQRNADRGRQDKKRIRIGIPNTFFWDELHPDIEDSAWKAAEKFETLGAVLLAVNLPDAELIRHHMAIMVDSDALTIHRERLRRSPERFGIDVRERLERATKISAEEYVKSQEWMSSWRKQCVRVLGDVDLVLTPTLRQPVPKIDVDGTEVTKELTKFCAPWSMASVPALSIPCGFDRFGLPVGLQLIARGGGEEILLRAGTLYQEVTDWHIRPPPLGGVERREPAELREPLGFLRRS